MPRPLELLLRVEQLAKVDGSFFITEELRTRHAKRIDGSESWRDPIGWVGADRHGEGVNALLLDLKFDRCISPTSNTRNRLTRHALKRKACVLVRSEAPEEASQEHRSER